MKKLLTALVFTLFVCFLTSFVCSADTLGKLEYSVSNGEVTIEFCDRGAVSIDIPETIKGYPVKVIGDFAFDSCDNLVHITIPNSVTSIGSNAFYYCTSLSDIILPNSLTSIGKSAFESCYSLACVTIPDEVTSIDDYAFYFCMSLENATVPESVTSIGVCAFDGGDDNFTIYGARGSYAETYAGQYGIPFVATHDAANAAGGLTASLPTFPVTLNGLTNSNDYSLYPLLVYNDITYFPMTYYDCRLLGLTTDWTPETGLAITKSDEVLSEYVHDVQDTVNPTDVGVQLATGAISVNGKTIDNGSEQYPLLFFRDVTYFPLTWRFAVEEFGWSYNFDAVNGLVISSGN